MTETETKPKPKARAEVEAELADAQALIEELLKSGVSEADNRPTVYEAWSLVMSEVQSVSKDSRNSQQNFNFRGIDAVMNVVGPALRRHGVFVVPEALSETVERYETKSKAQMVGRVAEVGFTVYGPRGDSFNGSAYGEAADSGDKAMSKAHSVAYRTFLLQALTIPTDEQDPDATAHERTATHETTAAPATNRARVEQADEAQAAPPVNKTPADEARDELRALAEKKGWDLRAVAAKFATAMRPDGQERNVDLKQASAIDVSAFRNLLETGAITL